MRPNEIDELTKSPKEMEMTTTSPRQSPVVVCLKILKNALLLVVIVLVILGGLLALLGQHERYYSRESSLGRSFDSSVTHRELLKRMDKNKLVMVYGRQQDGLHYFMDYYAGRMVNNNRTVRKVNLGEFMHDFRNVLRDIYQQIRQWYEHKPVQDWMIVGKGAEEVPTKVISQLVSDNPRSRIIIVTTVRPLKVNIKVLQAADKFKVFQFVPYQQEEMKSLLESQFNLSSVEVDVLLDYYTTHKLIYESLGNAQQFSLELVLGDHFVQLRQLNKEEEKMLKKLCKKGYAKTKKISQKLAELGVVFGKGKGLWANETARVNYQLQRKVNCKDKVASDEILSGIVSELGQEQNENGEQTEQIVETSVEDVQKTSLKQNDKQTEGKPKKKEKKSKKPSKESKAKESKAKESKAKEIKGGKTNNQKTKPDEQL